MSTTRDREPFHSSVGLSHAPRAVVAAVAATVIVAIICTPALAQTPSLTLTATGAPTATPPPGPIHITIGSAVGKPGDTVDVTVSMVGSNVAATGNDISFDHEALELDPPDCQVNPVLNKILVASVLRADRLTKTLRIFVTVGQNPSAIPSGPLYTCTFHVDPTTLPGIYLLTNRTPIAFAPDGSKLQRVVAASGILTVSLVVLPSATPTATATGTATPTPTQTPDPCPPELTLAPPAAPTGAMIAVAGRCVLVQGGRHAEVFFDTTGVADVAGDAVGNYAAVFTLPTAAAPGPHSVIVVALRRRQIAAGTLTVTAHCAGDCNSDGQVTADELLTLVDIALGHLPVAACFAGDANGDGQVTVADILTALSNALNGCPGA